MGLSIHTLLGRERHVQRPCRHVTVRPAQRGDLPVVRMIYNHAVAQADLNFEVHTWDTPATERWFANIITPDPVLVAELGDCVVGFACYTDFRPKCGYGITKESSVYVDAEFRRIGVAAALYRALIAHAHRHGVLNLIATISGPNRPSQAFHQSFGFRRVAVLPKIGCKHGVMLDAQLWQLCLERIS